MKVFRKFKWGKPWRLNDRALGVIIPIIRVDGGGREYLMLEETKGKVEIRDTGNIGEVLVESKADDSVFMRGGTVLQGEGTQSRVVTAGTILLPREKEIVKGTEARIPAKTRILIPTKTRIPVACIHSSHGISSGMMFQAKGYTPRSFHSHLKGYRTDQDSIWADVEHYTTQTLGDTIMSKSDNLVKVMDQVSRFKTDVDKIVKEAPREKNQVGMIVFDEKGVAGIELFDHPSSWKALVMSIVKNYADLLAREDTDLVFELKTDKLIPAAEKFWKKLLTCKDGEILFETKGAKTVSFSGDSIVGEYTILNGKGIHAIATRVEKAPTRPKRRWPITGPILGPDRGPVLGPDPGPVLGRPSSYGRLQWRTTGRDKSFPVLLHLTTPKTFGELATEYPKSRPSMVNDLNEKIEKGHIEKTFRAANGKPVYVLTSKGKAARKKALVE